MDVFRVDLQDLLKVGEGRVPVVAHVGVVVVGHVDLLEVDVLLAQDLFVVEFPLLHDQVVGEAEFLDDFLLGGGACCA